MHPLSRAQQFWLFAFLTAWAFFGLTGRDAWKPEEALALGPVLAWLREGVFPAAAQAPFHSLLAGSLAMLSGPWLDLQDGARLASGLLILLALLFTGLAARALHGPGYATTAALALLGCFGLMLRAHAMLPETALLMAYALLLYGIALARARVLAGATAIALAGLVLALTRGALDLAALLAIVALPLLSRDWREPTYRRALAFGLSALAVALLLWALFLRLRGGGALAGWWAQFFQGLAPVRSPLAILDLLSWFTWPVWPLALGALWHEHRRLARLPALFPALAALAVTYPLAHWPAPSGDGGALPVLVPLALLAAHGVATLRRGAAQAFYWFGVLCFLFFTLAFWVYFAALELGWPATLAAHMHKLAPGYQPGGVPPFMLGLAGLATLLWLVAIPLFPRAMARPVLVWATGMALTWLLLIALFRPWAETGWAYRPMIRDMAAHLPADACLRADVGPAMKVMLRLHLGDRYRDRGDCDYWLVQTGRRPMLEDGWPVAQIWRGYRPRDNTRQFLLLRRDG